MSEYGRKKFRHHLVRASQRHGFGGGGGTTRGSQHLRFDYQYDAYGYWIERTVSHRLEPNADERPSNIERRTISYYGQ